MRKRSIWDSPPLPRPSMASFIHCLPLSAPFGPVSPFPASLPIGVAPGLSSSVSPAISLLLCLLSSIFRAQGIFSGTHS